MFTPVFAMLSDCDIQSFPSKQLNSIDISPTSTVHVTPSSFERRFIDVLTRQAPVPQESMMSPTRPITEAFSISPALSMSIFPSCLA